MKRIDIDKRVMELEYNLICDFIKSRGEIRFTQKKIVDTSGVVRGITHNNRK